LSTDRDMSIRVLLMVTPSNFFLCAWIYFINATNIRPQALAFTLNIIRGLCQYDSQRSNN